MEIRDPYRYRSVPLSFDCYIAESARKIAFFRMGETQSERENIIMYFRTRCFAKIKLSKINIMYRINGTLSATCITARKKLIQTLYRRCISGERNDDLKSSERHRKKNFKCQNFCVTDFLKTSCFQRDLRVDFPRRFFEI